VYFLARERVYRAVAQKRSLFTYSLLSTTKQIYFINNRISSTIYFHYTTIIRYISHITLYESYQKQAKLHNLAKVSILIHVSSRLCLAFKKLKE
jgi:hypothetical protein